MIEGGGSSSPDVAADTPGARGFSKEAIGAATSKLISASIGDIAVVFSRSHAHKHYTLSDMEWMILPAVVTGQVYVAEAQHKESGARVPIAVVLWARVSDETDQRLSANPGPRIRLRPEEWASGDNIWIVDVAGDPPVIAGALQQLQREIFKEKPLKIKVNDVRTGPRVELLLPESSAA